MPLHLTLPQFHRWFNLLKPPFRRVTSIFLNALFGLLVSIYLNLARVGVFKIEISSLLLSFAFHESGVPSARQTTTCAGSLRRKPSKIEGLGLKAQNSGFRSSFGLGLSHLPAAETYGRFCRLQLLRKRSTLALLLRCPGGTNCQGLYTASPSDIVGQQELSSLREDGMSPVYP